MALPIRKNVQAMTPYSPGKPIEEVKRELGLASVVKLASNENPLGPSPRAVAAMRDAVESVHLYPDGAAFRLRQAIASHLGLPQEQLILGNGSDEILRMLGWVLIDSPEDEVLVGDPTFVVYADTAFIAPCRLVKVPLDHNYVHDLPAMARAITDRTRIIFIANPNNPTGTIIRKRDFDAFLRDVPETALVVLDEAYYEFAADVPDFPHALEYVKAGTPNVAGLRTFSKAYGLAGLRCGYGFGPLELADAIQRARQPFNVNAIAQAGCVAALQDTAHVELTVANNRRHVDRLAALARSLGARPIETYANFILLDIGQPATPVFEALLREGVIVRSGERLGCPTCLRISIGTDSEMDRFEVAFRQVLGAANQDARPLGVR